MTRQVLLLSGGVDSTAIAAWMKPDHALTISYGPVPAAGEIRASRAIAETLNIPHSVLEADCSAVGSGLMAGTAPDHLAPMPEWWPFRNQLLLTLAAAWAVREPFDVLLVG